MHRRKNYEQKRYQAPNEPNGGFPPIYMCTDNDKLNNDNPDTKKREYVAPKSSVSIKSIMEKKRNITPFFEIRSFIRSKTQNA